MTRRERREAERKGQAVKKEATYQYTAAQLEAIRQEAADEANRQLEEIKASLKAEATTRALRILACIPVKVLHDKFGFGYKRLNRFLDWTRIWLESCNEDEDLLIEIFNDMQADNGYTVEWRCVHDKRETTGVQASEVRDSAAQKSAG